MNRGSDIMGLGEYWRKRDFGITPEPEGKPPKETGGRSFCVQKHAATRLHYDFRLELKGVLLSWAVPKGPSYDPADKRLAMHTEDHPLEYGPFEGIIPAGQYGGGTVLLWDRGTWEPIEDPHKGYHTGRLKFRLHGEKLQGAWTLIKIKGRDARDDAKSWLLIKEKDETARPSAEYNVTEARPESVATGRQMEEIARDRDRVWNSNREDGGAEPEEHAKRRLASARKPAAAPRPAPLDPKKIPGARKGRLPARVEPQLATLVDAPPEGEGWLHEMKFDGYRILARVEKGVARLVSRNDKDWTSRFPTIAQAVEGLGAGDLLLDGEVAVVLPNGTTSFQALQNLGTPGADGEIVYFLFDLLHQDGVDLLRTALVERKALLRKLVPANGLLRFSDHVEGAGDAFFDTACRHGLEGIVSKRKGAPYGSGRGQDWLKVKCLKRQEFVIAGYTDPSGARVGVGALLLGVQEKDGLRFAGKVGTGFTSKTLRDLEHKLQGLRTEEVPFAEGKPKGLGSPHWVTPKLVAEVAFSEWTAEGRLRHPSFQGLREDKAAREVVRETASAAPQTGGKAPAGGAAAKKAAAKPPAGRIVRPKAADEAEVAGVRLTHPDRVMYPEGKITKRDIAAYFETIADWILPHVKSRPLTLVRCPEGLSKPCFYMKHTGVYAPPDLRRVKIQEKTKVGEYLVAHDLAGLVSLAQMGILEVHTWNSTDAALERPNRIVFDLDPDPSVGWDRVLAAAEEVKTRVQAVGLESFVKTTGGKGLHVVVPLQGEAGWDETLALSRVVSEQMVRDSPRSYTTEIPKAARKGKILIDYLRNNRGSTSVAAYSTRAKPHAPVSVPLTWDEAAKTKSGDELTLAAVVARLARLREDPWAGYWKSRQRFTDKHRKMIS